MGEQHVQRDSGEEQLVSNQITAVARLYNVRSLYLKASTDQRCLHFLSVPLTFILLSSTARRHKLSPGEPAAARPAQFTPPDRKWSINLHFFAFIGLR